jgi:hypothetical protein
VTKIWLVDVSDADVSSVRARLGACTLVEQICAIGLALTNVLEWTMKKSDVTGRTIHVDACDELPVGTGLPK